MAVRELTRSERVRNHDVEAEWRALPESEQPYLVCFMGMLGYAVLAVCDTEEEATEVLTLWQIAATFASLANNAPEQRAKYNYGNGLRVPGYTRHASPHDFQVRQQHDLDALTAAIIGSYR